MIINNNNKNTSMQNNSITYFYIHYCKSKSQRISKEIQFDLSEYSLTIKVIKSLIDEYFIIDVTKITIYDWKGLIIRDDIDLSKLIDPKNYMHNIFVTNISETLDSSHILSLFIIGKQLGEGGFGKVHLATYKYDTNEQFAIKFLKKDDVNDIDYLYKEINVLTSLAHEHVINFLTFCNTKDDRIALVMEYASGGTLHEYIAAKKKLNENEAREIFLQLTHTVKYIHNNGIIHRDLKPENILFEDKTFRNIKIIDFGISTHIHNNIKCVGTLPYIAPELLERSTMESTAHVDIWAMGCILYEMVTGHVVYKGKKDIVKEKMLHRKKFVYPMHLSVEVVNLIDLLCRYEPSERITITNILKHPWVLRDKIKDGKVIDRTKELFIDDKRFKRTSNSVQRKIGNLSLANAQLKTYKQISSCFKIKQQDNVSAFNVNEKEIMKGRTLTTPSKEKNNNKRKQTVLVTKLPSDFTDCDLLINYNRHFNNIPSYLEPIGQSKELKQFKQQYKLFLQTIQPSSGRKVQNNSKKRTTFNSAKRNVKRQKTLMLPNIQANGSNYKKNLLKINTGEEMQGNESRVQRGVKKTRTLKPQLSRFSKRHVLTEP